MASFIHILLTLGTVFAFALLLAPMLTLWRYGRRRDRSLGRGRFIRSRVAVIPLTAAFIALIAGLWKPLPIQFSDSVDTSLVVVGSLIYFPAMLLYFRALYTLREQYGVSSFTGADLQEGHQLITTGPYGHCRHPMYLGVICASFGALLMYQTWALLLLAPLSLTMLRRANLEEKLLAREFEPQWQAYAGKVPKWIPGIRRAKDRQ